MLMSVECKEAYSSLTHIHMIKQINNINLTKDELPPVTIQTWTKNVLKNILASYL